MSLLNKLIPNYSIEDGKLNATSPKVYIDDIYDPLFNQEAKNYLNQKYGNPLSAILGGYAEGISNAFFGERNGQWGILGPGMGILSNFGRSMDKTADLFLGGITEGVNKVSGMFNPNVQSDNAIDKIMVRDEDYQGKSLMAAMANTMSGMANGKTLSEEDFTGMWNVPSLGLELALDPGIAGMALARKGSKVLKTMPSSEIISNFGKTGNKSYQEIGQLLSNFDDFAAKIAINGAAPGSTLLLRKILNPMKDIIGVSTAKQYTNVPLGSSVGSPPKSNTALDVASNILNSKNTQSVEAVRAIDDMLTRSELPVDNIIENIVKDVNTTPQELEELTKVVEDIKEIRKIRELVDNPNSYMNELNSEMLRQDSAKTISEFKSRQLEANRATNAKFETLSPKLKSALYDGSKNTSAYSVGAKDFTPEAVDHSILEDVVEKYTSKNIDSQESVFFNSPSVGFNFDDYLDSAGKVDTYRLIEDLSNNSIKQNGKNVTDAAYPSIIKVMSEALDDAPVARSGVYVQNSKYYSSAKDSSAIQSIDRLIKNTSRSEFGSQNIYDVIGDVYKSELGDILKLKKSEDFYDFGMSRLVNASYKGKSLKNQSYLKAAEEFTRFTKNIKIALGKTSKPIDPKFYKLTELGDDIAEILQEGYVKSQISEVSSGKYDVSSNFRDIVKNSSSFKNADGTINVELYRELKNTFDEFSIRLSPDAKVKLVDLMKLDFPSYGIKDFEQFKSFVGDYTNYVKDLNKVFLSKKNPYFTYKELPSLREFRGVKNSKGLPAMFRNLIHTVFGNISKVVDDGKIVGWKYQYSDEVIKRNLDSLSKGMIPAPGVTKFMPEGKLTMPKVSKDIGVQNVIDKHLYVKTKNDYGTLTQFDARVADLVAYRDSANKSKNLMTAVQNRSLLEKGDLIKASKFSRTNLISDMHFTEDMINDIVDNTEKVINEYLSDPNIENLSNFLKSNNFRELINKYKNADNILLPEASLVRFLTSTNVGKGKYKILNLDIINKRIDAIRKNMLMSGNTAVDLVRTLEDSSAMYKPRKDILTTSSVRMEEAVVNEIAEMPVTEIAEKIKNPESVSLNKANEAIIESFQEYGDNVSDIDKVINSIGTPRERTLFNLINDATSIKPKIKAGDLPTLATESSIKHMEFAKQLNEKYTDEDKLKYLAMKDAIEGYSVKGANMLTDLAASRGVAVNLLHSVKDAKIIDDLIESIGHNLKVINKDYSIIKPIYKKTEYGTAIGYAFDSTNLRLIDELKKSKIDVDNLKDVIFDPAVKNADGSRLQIPESFKEIDTLFKEVQENTEMLSRMIGFDEFTEDYIKHTVTTKNPRVGQFLNETVYSTINVDDLQLLSSEAINFYKLKGTYGINPRSRSLKGRIDRFNKDYKVFDTNFENIVKNSYSKGIFDNINFQSSVDLIINNNYKINEFASSTEDLKRILFATDELGQMSGNTTNLMLVSPRYSETGKLTGFTRYDKFTDKGLEKALSNPETILIPNSVIAPLDSMLKKDLRMSNKMFAVINKYLTVPFKFGVLANPSFLIGNAGDAFFKQMSTFSKKYGTSVADESINVINSLKQVHILDNLFDQLHSKFIRRLQLSNITPNIRHKNVQLLLNSPDELKLFLEYVDDLPEQERDIAKFWLFINTAQESTVFRSSQNLDDLVEASTKSKYSPTDNILHRIFAGKGEYSSKDFKTWGLFVNNPISSTVIKSSGIIESYFRRGAIINDLKHKYSTDSINKILNMPKDSDEVVRAKVALNEALNSSHDINFDYENVSTLMDKATYAIPFPTFFLKNTSYWLEMMLENPQYIDNIIQVQESLWGDEDELNEDAFKAEAKGRGAVPIGFGQNLSTVFKGILKPTPMASMFSAFGGLNNPIDNLTYRLNPVVSPITGLLDSAEDVSYRPYNTDLYQPNINKDDPEFNSLKYLFHKLNPYDRAINTGLRMPTRVSEGTAQLADFVPSVFQPDF